MPRTDAANHVRTAPFIVGPWRNTTRKKKKEEEESGGGDGDDDGNGDASAGQRATTATATTTLTSAPPPPLAEEPDYDSAWDDDKPDHDAEEEEEGDEEEEEDATEGEGGGRAQEGAEATTLSGRGYLAFYSSPSSPSSPLRAVSGHLVDAASMSAIGVSGLEIDPADSGEVGPEVPPADACSFAAGDRLLALALFVKGGGGGRAGASETAPSPSAVVLALASGGDAATVAAPAPDPRGQGARRLLLVVAARGSKAAKDPPSSSLLLLSPPRGVRPPRLSFECGTLLAGDDAAAYLKGLGVVLPAFSGASGDPAAAAASDRELIVNVGTFEAAGAVFAEAGKQQRLRRPEAAADDIPFSEPARLSPSDPGYDPDFDS